MEIRNMDTSKRVWVNNRDAHAVNTNKTTELVVEDNRNVNLWRHNSTGREKIIWSTNTEGANCIGEAKKVFVVFSLKVL